MNTITNKISKAKSGIKTLGDDLMLKSRSLAQDFLRNESGTFVTIFGVSILGIFLSVGAAVDYSQMSRAKSLVNNSLDAAVLAAGNDLLQNDSNTTELRNVFENQLYANLSQHQNIMNAVTVDSFSVNKDTGKISATVGMPVQMAFMGLIGIKEMPVAAFTEATFSTTPVEISMVLDVTGSMNNGGKLASLKTAANKAVDILLPEGSNNSYVKVGLVPYSEGVRVPKQFAKKVTGQDDYTCMTERKDKDLKYTDVSYNVANLSADDRADCSISQIKPLTNKGKQLKTEITGMNASGYTAGHLGIAWGYYMLSENWQNLWKGASKPDDYGTKTKKIAILMTDGEFNSYFYDVNGNPTGPQQAKSNNDAVALCTDMKKSKKGGDGIEVYSIAFNAPTSAKQTLQKCATPNTKHTTYYYDANSQVELEAAFVEIAQSIKSLRLSK
ncbi:MAG: TadE/TadG family type IV pilus assembly protein [Salaquimonas sp.]